MNFLLSKVHASDGDNFDCKCSKLARAAYNDKDPAESLAGTEFDVIEFWRESVILGRDAQAFLAKDRATGVAYLAFRGTQTKPDVVVDVFAFPGYRLPETDHCWSHSGFNFAVASIEHKINAAIDSHKIDRVVVTGHSLGAALAGTYAIRNRHRVIETVTYGGPLFFWVDPEERQAAVREWPYSMKMTHFVYMEDPVPRILGDSMAASAIEHYIGGRLGKELMKWARGYIQLGDWIQLDENGKRSNVTTTSMPYDLLEKNWHFHSIDNYARAVCVVPTAAKIKSFLAKFFK